MGAFRRTAYPQRNVIHGAAYALEVANQHGHEIGGHLRRLLKLDRMFRVARAGSIRDHSAIRDGVVALVDDESDVKHGFVCGFVKAGECAPCVGRLELRDGIVALLTLAQIEAAQLVVKSAVEDNVQLGISGWDVFGYGYRGLVFSLLVSDAASLRLELGGLDFDLRGIQRDASHGLRQLKFDGLLALEGCGLQVRCEGELVANGGSVLREPLCDGYARRKKKHDCQRTLQVEDVHELELSPFVLRRLRHEFVIILRGECSGSSTICGGKTAINLAISRSA